MVSGCNHPANFSGSQVEPVVERGGGEAGEWLLELHLDSFSGLFLNPICYFSQAIYNTYQHRIVKNEYIYSSPLINTA
jgi:hypothetical protein